VLEQVSDPRIHPSALRMARVSLKNDWIKTIPFHYASEAVTMSLHRLTSKDNWPLALQGAAFKAEREAYLKAIDEALEEDKERDLRPETLAKVEQAAEKVRLKVEDTIPQSSPDWIPAQNFLKSIYGMVKMLRKPEIDQVLAALEKYPGTTVADLFAFMQMFNLRFGAATNPEERRLYLSMYPLLDEQRDKILAQSSGKYEGPPPAGNGPPGAIFHEMPWEHLQGKPGSNDKKPPEPKP
jgi:hypothetical protein